MKLIGKIKWFGNYKPYQQVNHGFIICDTGEEGKEKEIFVSKKNVPKEIQKIIEGKNGKGVFVKFDLIYGNRGLEAINLELENFVGLVGLTRTSVEIKKTIDCYQKNDIYLRDFHSFSTGYACSFYLRFDFKTGFNEAILVQKIDNCTTDINIIKKCIESKNKTLIKLVIINYLKTLSPDDAFDFLGKQLTSMDIDRNEEFELFYNMAKLAPEILIYSERLRDYIANDLYKDNLKELINFIDRLLEKVQDEKVIKTILIELKKHITLPGSKDSKPKFLTNFDFVHKYSKYLNLLWDVVPAHLKKKIVIEKYRNFVSLVDCFNRSFYENQNSIKCYWRDLYKFDDIDYQIINLWSNNETESSFNWVRMVSARGAEKLAIEFYRSLGYEVEDISSHQITNKSKNWLKGDILIDNEKILDVKNARRTAINSKVYSNFLVPKFKKIHRDDLQSFTNVCIVAIFSPDLKRSNIENPEKYPFYSQEQEVILLGDCNKPQIDSLEKFGHSYTTNLELDLSRNLKPHSYLPHWLFDYDESFYREQIQIIQDFQKLPDQDIPNEEELAVIDVSVFPLFIASKRKIPDSKLPYWQTKLLEILSNVPEERITLPYLFMSILQHFLIMLSCKDKFFSQKLYLEIFYPSSSYCEHLLKIYDPLNSIKNFCDTLQMLWEHKRENNFEEFKIFKFNARGWLQGKTSSSGSYKTLIAYCGGKVIEKGYFKSCGFAPLVLGSNEICLDCNHLICPKCRHCSQGCSSGSRRKLEGLKSE